jgi:FkbM family methyltransferase
MYSQHDEEQHIVDRFGEDSSGRFLDIGAFDGKTFSNVRRLWELGWSGVLVEPNPSSFKSLMQNFPDGEGEKVDLVNVAIGADRGLMAFHASDDAVSTLSEKHHAIWKDQAKYRKIHVCVVEVAHLIAVFPGPYRFINLDVEGMNFEILQQLPLDDLACECICVEYEDKGREILLWMAERQWKMVMKNGENYIFVR